MKFPLGLLSISLCCLLTLSACADSEQVKDNLYRGMYDGLRQSQKMEHPEDVPPTDQEPMTYDQYKKERQDMLPRQEQEKSQSSLPMP